MAPAYANIAMSIFEPNSLTDSRNKPLVWLCYIDYIFAIWAYSEDKCKDFLLYINSIHSCFQFTCSGLTSVAVTGSLNLLCCIC